MNNKDPLPGWVDTVSAAGALYLLGGIGLIQVTHGNKHVVGDQVPVDYVVDSIIVAAAAYARTKELKVIHCGTSGSNPVSWGYACKMGTDYWKTYPPQKRVATCNFRLQKNKKLLKVIKLFIVENRYIYF